MAQRRERRFACGFPRWNPTRGVSGPVSFDENGDVVERSFDRFEIQDGKVSLISESVFHLNEDRNLWR
uniref:Uncharacterized protein n=1 Tax=Candidatus Kentrum sp. LPFa TaxID=2126335 RepID=A0A450XNP8_9GAMM|nr:MAG: hypothetical protein BECKLPF1236A_GA0070988_101216 [Candidatus Kentron sp. LPFa]VFK30942.1 MAG: hypothetical protein BECKLPF1236C_GA0070990_101246 [Candidatus Kentron sp. LPFa]